MIKILIIYLIEEITGCKYLTEHINIIAEGDYLARHNGKSKNFYDLYQHYNLSVNAHNSREGITKTYLSIVKHYERNSTENRKSVKKTRLYHI